MCESVIAILVAAALLCWVGRSMDRNEAQDRERRERLAEIERALNKGQ